MQESISVLIDLTTKQVDSIDLLSDINAVNDCDMKFDLVRN